MTYVSSLRGNRQPVLLGSNDDNNRNRGRRRRRNSHRCLMVREKGSDQLITQAHTASDRDTETGFCASAIEQK